VGTLGRDKNVGVAVYRVRKGQGRGSEVTMTLSGEWASAGRSGFEVLEMQDSESAESSPARAAAKTPEQVVDA